MPDYITQNKSLTANERDKNGHVYKDELCFFRALVKSLGGDCTDFETVLTLYEKYRRHVNGPIWTDFEGIPEQDKPIAEQMFNVNVQIVQYSENEMKILKKATNPNRPTVTMFFQPFEK